MHSKYMETCTLKLPTSVADTSASLRRQPVARRPCGYPSIVPEPYAHGPPHDEFNSPNGYPTDQLTGDSVPFADYPAGRCAVAANAGLHPGRLSDDKRGRSIFDQRQNTGCRLPGRSRTTPQEARLSSPPFRYPKLRRRSGARVCNQEAIVALPQRLPPSPRPFFSATSTATEPMMSEWNVRLVEGSGSRWRHGVRLSQENNSREKAWSSIGRKSYRFS
ncbi:hypothetical protein ACVIHF_008657 [Bradyrhizobium sp. USDA 4506]